MNFKFKVFVFIKSNKGLRLWPEPPQQWLENHFELRNIIEEPIIYK
jgi:hypothetical protein